jgi:hypothetical protein
LTLSPFAGLVDPCLRGFEVSAPRPVTPSRIMHSPSACLLCRRFLILLTPCAMLAACYQLLGLIANALGPDTIARDCLPIRTTRIAKIFVTVDIITFIVQLAGSGLSIQDGTAGKIGMWTALVGSTSSCRTLLPPWAVPDGLCVASYSCHPTLYVQSSADSRRQALTADTSCSLLQSRSAALSPSSSSSASACESERWRSRRPSLHLTPTPLASLSRSRYVQLWYHHDSRFSWSPKEIFSWQEVDNWKVAYLTTLVASVLLWIRCVYRAAVRRPSAGSTCPASSVVDLAR